MGDIINVGLYKTLVEKCNYLKRIFARPMNKWGDIITTYLKVVCCDGVNRINLFENRSYSGDGVNAMMIFLVHKRRNVS
jgi:hypothetical protein